MIDQIKRNTIWFEQKLEKCKNIQIDKNIKNILYTENIITANYVVDKYNIKITKPHSNYAIIIALGGKSIHQQRIANHTLSSDLPLELIHIKTQIEGYISKFITMIVII